MGGDGASRHVHLITVSFKKKVPIRQEILFKAWGGEGDGASRHAHLITVSFKRQPIRQEVSCFKGGGRMVLADIPT